MNEIQADQFCASVRDGTHDSPRQAESGRKLVTSKHIVGRLLNHESAYRISEADFEAINKRSKVDQWDVLISMIGTVGEPCLIEVEPDFAIKNIGLFKSKSELDGRWLYYFLCSPEAQQEIQHRTRGSTQGYISLGNLRSLPIRVPADRGVMDGIVDFLSTLDQKIANNRALAADLEAMARAIFKSWFVDFDPVKAKIQGRAPAGMDADTAALFPDELVESELGLIPKGWEVAPLNSKARLDTTSVKPFDQPETQWSHYSILAFDDGGYPANNLGSEIKSGKHWVNPHAILVSKLNPSQWRCWRPDPLVLGKHSICSPEFMQIVGEGVPRNWIWGLCHSQPFKDLVNATTDGTTGSRQRAKPKLVMQQSVVFPSNDIVTTYDELVQPILSRSDKLIHEIQELAALRDCLLPRLISGKLRLPEAAIAEATA